NQHLKDEHSQYIKDELFKILEVGAKSKENVIEYAKKFVESNDSDPKCNAIKDILKIKDDVIAYSKIFIDNIHIEYVKDELYKLLKDECENKEKVIEYARTIAKSDQVDQGKFKVISEILKINDDVFNFSKIFINTNPNQYFKDELYKHLQK